MPPSLWNICHSSLRKWATHIDGNSFISGTNITVKACFLVELWDTYLQHHDPSSVCITILTLYVHNYLCIFSSILFTTGYCIMNVLYLLQNPGHWQHLLQNLGICSLSAQHSIFYLQRIPLQEVALVAHTSIENISPMNVRLHSTLPALYTKLYFLKHCLQTNWLSFQFLNLNRYFNEGSSDLIVNVY